MVGLNARQTGDAGAVEEPDEKGLYLIVAVVGSYNICSPQLAPLGLEHFVSNPPRRRLSVFPGHRGFVHWVAQKTRLHPQSGADLLRQGRPATRVAIEAVVDVQGVKLDSEIRGDLFQAPKKRCGIGSAREGDQESVACVDHKVALEKPCDLGQ